MKLQVIGNRRKDGKYKAKIIYPGAPNMFGGRDYPRVFTKLLTAEGLIKHAYDAESTENFPSELGMKS